MLLTNEELVELRGRPFQRKVIIRPDHSPVTVWVDGKGALRLTVAEKPATIPVVETGGLGAGNEDGP